MRFNHPDQMQRTELLFACEKFSQVKRFRAHAKANHVPSRNLPVLLRIVVFGEIHNVHGWTIRSQYTEVMSLRASL